MATEDILNSLFERRSVRSFLPKKVEVWKEKRIMEAGNAAPSAGNLQARFFYLIKNPKLIDDISRAAYGQSFIAEAPLVSVVCSDSTQAASRYADRGALYAIQDATASIQNILIAVHSLGLGSCWVGAFDENEVRELLSIPPNLKPIAILPIGYSNEKPHKTSRRPLNEVSKTIL